GYGEHGSGPVPPNAVQALVPAVGAYTETFHGGAAVIEQGGFFFEGKAGDEVMNTVVDRFSGVQVGRVSVGRGLCLQRAGEHIPGNSQTGGYSKDFHIEALIVIAGRYSVVAVLSGQGLQVNLQPLSSSHVLKEHLVSSMNVSPV